MCGKRRLTDDEISELICNLQPIDWQRMEMLSRMLPGARLTFLLNEAEQTRQETKEKLHKEHPEMNERELNLKMLEMLTGDEIPEKAWELVRKK